MLRVEEKNDGVRYEGEARRAQLFAEAEEGMSSTTALSWPANADEDALGKQELFCRCDGSHGHAARAPVDAFFDRVTVNCEDPALRRNRLLMLSQIRSTLDRVADFSRIEG